MLGKMRMRKAGKIKKKMMRNKRMKMRMNIRRKK